jgi:hypothetical protein
MIHTPERVQAIREKRAFALNSVATLEAQVPDPGFRQRLQLIRHELDDIELFFLASLSKKSRTPAQEAYWLGQAEMLLDVFIAPQLRDVQVAFAKYGPTVTLV